MANIYGQAKICPYNGKDDCQDDERLVLEPDLYEILAKSTNYDELTYVWSEWRRVSGRLMLDDYEEYVDLVNEAAVLNGKYINLPYSVSSSIE